MKNIQKIVLATILSFGLIVGSLGLTGQVNLAGAAQNFTPVQTQYFTLGGAGVGITGTTVTLTRFILPNGTLLTMSNFGIIGYGTIEPGGSKEEQISFTGVVQNANGTATLTGVVRGIQFVYPYATVAGNIFAHAGGSRFVISNTAAFYSRFLSPLNDATTSSQYIFSSTTPPAYDVNPNFGNFASTTFASVSYVNNTATSGAANASETVKGLVELSTGAEAAAGTSLGGTGARLSIPGSLGTTTCVSVANTVPVTGANGKISSTCIDQTATYAWTGNQTYAASSTYNLVPPGSIEAYATSTAPVGWLLADGTSYSTSTFPNLFAVLGYFYGGNGTSTFAVPNTKGRFLYSAGSSTTPTLGVTGGATTTTLVQANVPAYNLSLNTVGNTNTSAGVAAGDGSAVRTVSFSNGGSSTPFNTLPPYFVVNYIIKY